MVSTKVEWLQVRGATESDSSLKGLSCLASSTSAAGKIQLTPPAKQAKMVFLARNTSIITVIPWACLAPESRDWAWIFIGFPFELRFAFFYSRSFFAKNQSLFP